MRILTLILLVAGVATIGFAIHGDHNHEEAITALGAVLIVLGVKYEIVRDMWTS